MGRPTTALGPGQVFEPTDPYRNMFWCGSVNVPYYPQMPVAMLQQMASVGLAPYNYQQAQYQPPAPPPPPYTAEARTKARELLLLHLDEKQRADFEERQYFDIIKDQHRYRIICGGSLSHNIKLLDQNTGQVTSLCCYPSDAHTIPPEDVYLAQKLNIEASEADFLLQANHNRLTRAEAHQLESPPRVAPGLKLSLFLSIWAAIGAVFYWLGL